MATLLMLLLSMTWKFCAFELSGLRRWLRPGQLGCWLGELAVMIYSQLECRHGYSGST